RGHPLRELAGHPAEARSRVMSIDLTQGSSTSPASSRERFEIVVAREGLTALVQPVRCGEPVRIGRAPDCTVALEDDAISRYHALLRVDEAGVTVEDTSTNGTLADGMVLRRAERRVAFGRPLVMGAYVF